MAKPGPEKKSPKEIARLFELASAAKDPKAVKAAAKALKNAEGTRIVADSRGDEGYMDADDNRYDARKYFLPQINLPANVVPRARIEDRPAVAVVRPAPVVIPRGTVAAVANRFERAPAVAAPAPAPARIERGVDAIVRPANVEDIIAREQAEIREMLAREDAELRRDQQVQLEELYAAQRLADQLEMDERFAQDLGRRPSF